MLITSGKSDYDVKPLKQLNFLGGKMHILPPQSLFYFFFGGGAAAPAAPHFSRPCDRRQRPLLVWPLHYV